MRGVPLRLEIGPKDMDKQQAVLVSRLDRKKSFVPWGELAARTGQLLEGIQSELFRRAQRFQEENTRPAADLAGLKVIMENQRGFVRAFWCGSRECETRVKDETSATIRVILDEAGPAAGRCAVCGQPAAQAVPLRQSLLSVADEFTRLRRKMVDEQICPRGVSDSRVLAAMESVPRQRFVPEAERGHSYDDAPLAIGFGQTISQPYIVAYMTELLELRGRGKGAGNRHWLGIPDRRAGRNRQPGVHGGNYRGAELPGPAAAG